MFLGKNRKPTALIILDGWGVAPSWGGNAISQARTKTYDKLLKSYPNTTLLASGDSVGLPTNSPGNSEAGHLNIGAGRVIHQDITLIDQHIDDGSFFKNEILLKSIEHAKRNRSRIHLMGLLSKTGTHSHIKHIYTLLELIKAHDFSRVYIHLFSDGRDSDPMSGIEMVDEVENRIKQIGIGKIVSVSGRFYAMDRDNRWGRVARAYNLLVKGEGNCFESSRAAFTSSYSVGTTDEFIEPRFIASKTQQKVTVEDNDAVIIFNFRSDRVKELIRAFLDEKIEAFPDRKRLNNLYLASFVIYDDHLLSKQVFSPEMVEEPIGKVWSEHGLKQFHIAETEKYPHVTYFINGGVEKPYSGEDRLMIPSPRNTKTYDYIPQMSAEKITSSLIKAIKSNLYDRFIVNYANPDMVGHTGNLSATVQAVECVDTCLGRLLGEITEKNGLAFITADHGNAEQMVNPATGEAHTEHTTNPVPFIIVGNQSELKNIKLESNGILASITPTILDMTNMAKPSQMRNSSLIIRDNIRGNNAAG